jgi:hypothetical protein
MHQRFDRVHQELTENRERMAKLERTGYRPVRLN